MTHLRSWPARKTNHVIRRLRPWAIWYHSDLQEVVETRDWVWPQIDHVCVIKPKLDLDRKLRGNSLVGNTLFSMSFLSARWVIHLEGWWKILVYNLTDFSLCVSFGLFLFVPLCYYKTRIRIGLLVFCKSLFFSSLFIFAREGIPSKFCTISMEPYRGLKLMNLAIMTWAKVNSWSLNRFTDWTTQAPL